jgi:hypothetical protein
MTLVNIFQEAWADCPKFRPVYLGGIHKVREAAPPRIAFKSIPDMNLK